MNELDHVQWRKQPTGVLRGELWIDAGLGYFAGHFPGNPILPGVVQVHWALLASATLFAEKQAARFCGMTRVKFRAPVVPNQKLTLDLAEQGDRVVFSFHNAAGNCTQGTLQYRD